MANELFTLSLLRVIGQVVLPSQFNQSLSTRRLHVT